MREMYDQTISAPVCADRRLETLEAPEVGTEGHEAGVGLVAENGDRDDLVTVVLART